MHILEEYDETTTNKIKTQLKETLGNYFITR